MKKKAPVRIKIAKYLFGFAAGLIILLLVFQIGLLQPMYEHYKRSAVKSAGEEITFALQNYEGTELNQQLYRVSASDDACIRIIQGNTDTTAGNGGGLLYRMSTQEIATQVSRASESEDQTYLETRTSAFATMPGGPTDNSLNPRGADSNVVQELIYTQLVEIEGVTTVIMTSTTLTPISATMSTLRIQIFYISLIVIAAMAILTWLFNRHLAQPLAAINGAAKELSEGRYRTPDADLNYQEAQELDATLQQAAIDINKAEKARRDLISNVSHDLRTPLTMISGYGQMMQDLPGEKTDENLQVIVDESNRLTALVNDLLDLSRLQNNRIELKLSVFNMTDLIHQELRKYEIYHVKDGFDFETELDDDLYVKADRSRIAQVFNNFIINAINYSGTSLRIIIRAKKDDDSAHIEIQDFGEGISEDQQKDIWDRYYKIDREHVRHSNGSGIGLSIVKQLLELHHARYGVRSKPEDGSTFWFDLPLADPPGADSTECAKISDNQA